MPLKKYGIDIIKTIEIDLKKCTFSRQAGLQRLSALKL